MDNYTKMMKTVYRPYHYATKIRKDKKLILLKKKNCFDNLFESWGIFLQMVIVSEQNKPILSACSSLDLGELKTV